MDSVGGCFRQSFILVRSGIPAAVDVVAVSDFCAEAAEADAVVDIGFE